MSDVQVSVSQDDLVEVVLELARAEPAAAKKARRVSPSNEDVIAENWRVAKSQMRQAIDQRKERKQNRRRDGNGSDGPSPRPIGQSRFFRRLAPLIYR